MATVTCAQPAKPFKYKVAIIGNPENPVISYDSVTLSRLKCLGFNTLQLNIAWGARPADEPLNLEDILYVEGKGDKAKVEKRFSNIKERAQIAKHWGFRTIFHFGAPNLDSLYRLLSPEKIDVATEQNSIQKKEIVDRYVSLLHRLHSAIPEIDDILVYTFDQEAWIANEFGNGKTDRGIPLHERLPHFLQTLTNTWASLNNNGRLWWEPWELSAGQIYACLPNLPTKNFGLTMHSNIAEVQFTRPIDVWFKNMLNLLTDKGVPVMSEIFMSGANEELQPLQHVFAPRLVYEEIEAMYNLHNVTGIKEYFGTVAAMHDPALQMAGLKLNNPSISLQQALTQLAAPYGKASAIVLQAWEATAKGIQLFPWDCSWRFRLLPTGMAGVQVYHRWDAGQIAGSVAPSPSWKSTRRSLFMITEDEPLNNWFFEDIELRSEAAANQLVIAINTYEQLIKKLPKGSMLSNSAMASLNDIKKLEQTMRAIQCYCREVNLTWLMRDNLNKNQPLSDELANRFRSIMKIDIANQQKGLVTNDYNAATAADMLKAFDENPEAWVKEHLIIR